MSAIIAGQKCSKCQKSYWVSLGSPDWWKKVAIYGRRPNPMYMAFANCRHSSFCPSCYLEKIDMDSIPGDEKDFIVMLQECLDLVKTDEERLHPVPKIKRTRKRGFDAIG